LRNLIGTQATGNIFACSWAETFWQFAFISVDWTLRQIALLSLLTSSILTLVAVPVVVVPFLSIWSRCAWSSCERRADNLTVSWSRFTPLSGGRSWWALNAYVKVSLALAYSCCCRWSLCCVCRSSCSRCYASCKNEFRRLIRRQSGHRSSQMNWSFGCTRHFFNQQSRRIQLLKTQLLINTFIHGN
jgi:flagellar biosynthesis protein FlhB